MFPKANVPFGVTTELARTFAWKKLWEVYPLWVVKWLFDVCVVSFEEGEI